MVTAPTLLLGHPQSLLQRWLAYLGEIRSADRTRPILTLVPDTGLVRFLENVLLHGSTVFNVRVMTLAEWAFSRLPEEAQPLPASLNRVLARSMPERLLAPYPEASAALARTLVDESLEILRQGIPVQALKEAAHPLTPVLEWIQPLLQGSWHEVRVYQYAARKENATAPWPAGTVLYGFTEATPAQWIALAHLGRQGPLILTPWPGDRKGIFAAWRYLAPWIQRWQSEGATVTALPAPEPGEVRQWACSSGDEAEAAVRAVQYHLQESSGGLKAKDFVAVGVEGATVTALGVRGRSAGIPFAAGQGPSSDEALWRVFLRVCQGRASRPETLRWLQWRGVEILPEVATLCFRQSARWYDVLSERVPAAREMLTWARDWNARLQAVLHWAEVKDLVVEAVNSHQGANWPAIIDEVSRWNWFDGLGLVPDPVLVRECLMECSIPNAPPYDEILVTSGLTALAAGPRTILAFSLGKDEGPGTVFASDRRRQRARQNYWRRVLLTPAQGQTVWLVGSRWPSGLGEEMSDGNMPPWPQANHQGEASLQWYHGWVESKAFNSFSGEVGDEARPLYPKKWSPSALETFGRCPLQFFYGRVIEVAMPDGDGESIRLHPTWRGRWAHSALEWIAHQRGKADRSLASMVEDAVSYALAQLPAPQTVSPAAVDVERQVLISELTEALLRERTWSGEVMETATEISVEWEIATGSHRWLFTGRIDRLDRLSDGRWMLIDYKTGKIVPPHRVAPDNLQLVLYHEGVSRSLGLAELGAGLVGISQKSEFQVKILTEPAKLYPIAHRMLQGIWERIGSGRFYPIPDGRADPCRTCGYRPLCPGKVKDYAGRQWHEAREYHTLWEDAIGSDGIEELNREGVSDDQAP